MSEATRHLAIQIRCLRLPPPELEYRFHPVRRWRFDYCWPTWLVACEVEGGVGYAVVKSKTGKAIVGHHLHPATYESDCEKYSEAALLGWAVIRVTPKMIKDGRAIDLLERVLHERMAPSNSDADR